MIVYKIQPLCSPHQTNKAHQGDLVQQKEYQELSKKMEKQQLKEDWSSCLEAEAAYQRKVKEELNKPWPSPHRNHPTKLALTGRGLL